MEEDDRGRKREWERGESDRGRLEEERGTERERERERGRETEREREKEKKPRLRLEGSLRVVVAYAKTFGPARHSLAQIRVILNPISEDYPAVMAN